MKILLYSANFAPEPVGIGKYSGEMAAWLATQGHEVRVVAAPPYYPAWKLAKGYGWPLYRREQWQGVDVWRAPIWVPKGQGGLMRILHLATFAASSLPVMLWQILWRPDVVMTVAPAMVCAPAGWLVAKLSGAKSWMHVQDFEVDMALRMGLIKGVRLSRAIRAFESLLLRGFDVVSTISGSMGQHLLRKSVPQERTYLLINWADVDHIRPLTRPSSYRAELELGPEVKVALFSGTLSAKQGLMVIPDAARLLAGRSDLLFLVCGDGVMHEAMAQAAQELPNLRLLPLQPLERLNDLLGLADVHLLPQCQDAEDLVLPSKLTGMLASGRPVIATCRLNTEIANVVGECGLIVESGDSRALAGAIEQLADDPMLRQQMGKHARLYAETHLASEAVLARMANKLETLVYGHTLHASQY